MGNERACSVSDICSPNTLPGVAHCPLHTGEDEGLRLKLTSLAGFGMEMTERS